MDLLYFFLKPKHPVRKLFVHRSSHIRVVRVWMMAVEKLHDVEAAAIHVEVDIPLLEIRRDGLPDLDFRVQAFHRTPCGVANAGYFQRDFSD